MAAQVHQGAAAGALHIPEPIRMRSEVFLALLDLEDLADFLDILARPETAKFLAERGGLLLPFVGRLLLRAPGILVSLLFGRRQPKKGA